MLLKILCHLFFLGREAISQSNGMIICRGCKIYLQLLLSVKTNKQTNKQTMSFQISTGTKALAIIPSSYNSKCQ